jgi:hypothetical protein
MSCIEVELMTQIKAAAGCSGLEIECGAPMPVSSVLAKVVERCSVLEPLLLDETGVRRGWLMVSIDGAMVARGSDPPVRPGSTVLLGTPISGG